MTRPKTVLAKPAVCTEASTRSRLFNGKLNPNLAKRRGKKEKTKTKTKNLVRYKFGHEQQILGKIQ